MLLRLPLFFCLYKCMFVFFRKTITVFSADVLCTFRSSRESQRMAPLAVEWGQLRWERPSEANGTASAQDTHTHTHRSPQPKNPKCDALLVLSRFWNKIALIWGCSSNPGTSGPQKLLVWVRHKTGGGFVTGPGRHARGLPLGSRDPADPSAAVSVGERDGVWSLPRPLWVSHRPADLKDFGALGPLLGLSPTWRHDPGQGFILFTPPDSNCYLTVSRQKLTPWMMCVGLYVWSHWISWINMFIIMTAPHCVK